MKRKLSNMILKTPSKTKKGNTMNIHCIFFSRHAIGGEGDNKIQYFHLSRFHHSTRVTYKPTTNKQRRSLAGEGEEEAGEGDVRSFPKPESTKTHTERQSCPQTPAES